MPSGRTATACSVGSGRRGARGRRGEAGVADGAIEGNKPVALPGVISVRLISLRLGSGPGWIAPEVGAGEASGVGAGRMSRTDSETARGCESLAADTSPTALTVVEVAVCLAVTWAWSPAGSGDRA